jgi:hypothetical protein
MIYAKCLQRDELYNYYKMDESRQSVGVEAIHFLNPTPQSASPNTTAASPVTALRSRPLVTITRAFPRGNIAMHIVERQPPILICISHAERESFQSHVHILCKFYTRCFVALDEYIPLPHIEPPVKRIQVIG